MAARRPVARKRRVRGMRKRGEVEIRSAEEGVLSNRPHAALPVHGSNLALHFRRSAFPFVSRHPVLLPSFLPPFLLSSHHYAPHRSYGAVQESRLTASRVGAKVGYKRFFLVVP